MTRRFDERGSGTVLAAGMILALVALAVGASVLVGWLVSDSRAHGAADLTALAAARAFAAGGDGCEVAELTAQANEAELTACHVLGQRRSFVAEVTVRVPLAAGLGQVGLAAERTSSAGTG